MRLSRNACACAALVAVALATMATPAPAASWNCDASAVRATLLGAAPVEPVTANRGQATCRAQTASGSLLAGALSARTSLTGANPTGQQARATGEVAGLELLGLPLPPGVGVIELPSPLPLILPGPITVDLRRALQDLLRPDLGIRVAAARSTATATCVNGSPRLDGVSDIAGLTVAGVALPTDRALEQAITLVDTSQLDLSRLDVTKIDLPLVPPELTGLVQTLLAPALANLELDIAPILAQVRVTPREQIVQGGRLTQRALHVEISALGQTIADVVAGEASVSHDGVDCHTRFGNLTMESEDLTAADLALACTRRDLVLIDVVPGKRVRLLGAADRRLVGRTVRMFAATGEVVARARVGTDRLFRATAPMPPPSIRGTNRARYEAVIGDERSLRLKLMRRMHIRSIASQDGKVTISGRVVRPLDDPVREVTVRRQLNCRRAEVVARFRPARSGRFRVTVDAPPATGAAMYRLTTRVRKVPHRAKLYPTFTLPRVVDLRP